MSVGINKNIYRIAQNYIAATKPQVEAQMANKKTQNPEDDKAKTAVKQETAEETKARIEQQEAQNAKLRTQIDEIKYEKLDSKAQKALDEAKSMDISTQTNQMSLLENLLKDGEYDKAQKLLDEMAKTALKEQQLKEAKRAKREAQNEVEYRNATPEQRRELEIKFAHESNLDSIEKAKDGLRAQEREETKAALDKENAPSFATVMKRAKVGDFEGAQRDLAAMQEAGKEVTADEMKEYNEAIKQSESKEEKARYQTRLEDMMYMQIARDLIEKERIGSSLKTLG